MRTLLMLIKRALKKEKTNVAIGNYNYNYELAIKKSKQSHTQGNKTSWYSYRSPNKKIPIINITVVALKYMCQSQIYV